MVSITDIPGVDSDNSKRQNIIIGGVYVVGGVIALPFLISVLAIFIMFLPIILGVIMADDWHGIASQLSNVPGIEQGGGVGSGIMAFVYMIVIVGTIAAVGGIGDSDATDPAIERPPTATETRTATMEVSALDMTGVETRMDHSGTVVEQYTTDEISSEEFAQNTVKTLEAAD